jgi:hypothetical protein
MRVRIGAPIHRVGLAAFDLIMIGMQTVLRCGDDTLRFRSERKVFGAGLHRDPVLSSRGNPEIQGGRCWAMRGVIVECRWASARRFAWPMPCQIDLNRQPTTKWNRAIGKQTELKFDEVQGVAAQHLRGDRGGNAFSNTAAPTESGTETTAEMHVRHGSWRRPMEVLLQDTQQHLGVDEPQQHTPRAARRTAPVGLVSYGLIVRSHETIRSEPARILRFWLPKRGKSFTEMLASLRRDSLNNAEKTELAPPTPALCVNTACGCLKKMLPRT